MGNDYLYCLESSYYLLKIAIKSVKKLILSERNVKNLRVDLKRENFNC